MQASGYFNIFNIINILILLSANAKSAVLLKSSVITKVEVCNFPLLHIPRCLCLVNGQLAMSLRHVKRTYVNSVSVSSIFNNGQFYINYYFLFHSNCPLQEIQFSINCYVSILNFKQNSKNHSVLYNYRLWRNVPNFSKNFPLLMPTDWRSKTSFLSMLFKCFSISFFL